MEKIDLRSWTPFVAIEGKRQEEGGEGARGWGIFGRSICNLKWRLRSTVCVFSPTLRSGEKRQQADVFKIGTSSAQAKFIWRGSTGDQEGPLPKSTASPSESRWFLTFYIVKFERVLN